ncbi:hypothetical protein DY000_02060373, partial [Brassica cretica]
IRNMAEKVPSFKTGGTLWFTDLTTADTTYILPLLTAITFIIMVEEGMEGNPVAGTMKKFARIIAFLSIPILMGIEKEEVDSVISDIPRDGPRRPTKNAVRDWAAIFRTASRAGQARPSPRHLQRQPPHPLHIPTRSPQPHLQTPRPVTSTAIQMVFGDTIAVAANHPAGQGCYEKKEELQVCKEGDLIVDQLVELTSKGCGCLLVVDHDHRLMGTFTDGDLRRTLKASGEAIFKLSVGEMCNRKPRKIGPETRRHYLDISTSPVQFLPVVDEDNTLIGIITLHGMVSAGL